MSIKFTLILLISTLLASVWGEDEEAIFDKKCKALVLEGGGDKGAYQAGVIRGMYEAMGKKEGKYDVLSGVSAGAVNALAYSFFEIGDEEKATQFLSKYYLRF